MSRSNPRMRELHVKWGTRIDRFLQLPNRFLRRRSRNTILSRTKKTGFSLMKRTPFLSIGQAAESLSLTLVPSC
jgi:hypothetical protein